MKKILLTGLLVCSGLAIGCYPAEAKRGTLPVDAGTIIINRACAAYTSGDYTKAEITHAVRDMVAENYVLSKEEIRNINILNDKEDYLAAQGNAYAQTIVKWVVKAPQCQPQ